MRSEESVVNIIFDAGRGTAPIASREGVVGAPLGELPRPTRSGYTFGGWYLGGRQVDAETLIEGNEDLRLTAKWEKVGGKERKKTVMWKQKVTAAVLAAAIVLLTAAILIANQIVLIYHLTDEYTDAEGVHHSDRYTIKKSEGVYKLFDRDGKLMETTENGYTSNSDNVRYEVYVAEKSGNQYLLNTSTGSYETYAVVDYDSDSGESLGGTVKNRRVMMFPRVGQDNTYSIEVKNQYGSFTFYRENIENGKKVNGKDAYTTAVNVKKGEGEDAKLVLAAYDPTLFASLCVSCGYSLTMQKLDFTDPETPRKADGSVDLNAYGLVDRYDENGALTYTPTVYTIVQGETLGDQSDKPGSMIPTDTVYTVRVGDAILSGGGYYVQLVGRDAVYIVSSSIAETVLQPVEALVTPALIYPMTVSTYVMVNDFFFGTVADMSKIDEDNEEESKKNINIKIMFDYVDLAKRQDSLYSSSPYWITEKLGASMGDGFVLDNDSVSTVLGSLYQMKFLGCKVLNPTDDDLAKYKLDKDIYLLHFKYDPQVASGGSDEKDWADNWIFISQKQKNENGDTVYYAYSSTYNMIAEIDRSQLAFLEWSDSHWYNKYFFQQNISYVKHMTVKYGDKLFDMVMDNTLSYAYYDKAEGSDLPNRTKMSLLTGALVQLSNGNYKYTDPETKKTYTLASSNVRIEYDESGTMTGYCTYIRTGTLIDLEKGTLSADGTKYTVTKTGKTYSVRQIDFSKTQVESYTNKNKTKTTNIFYRDDYGTEMTVSAGSQNLQVICNGTRIDYTLTETVKTDTGKTETETYTALDNFRRFYSKLLWSSIEGDVSVKELGEGIVDYVKHQDPTMEITVHVEDMASVLNRDNYSANNKQSLVIRMYRYTEGKALLTVEVLADENATPDPTSITKGFYVLADEVKYLAQYAEDFVNGKLIPKSN